MALDESVSDRLRAALPEERHADVDLMVRALLQTVRERDAAEARGYARGRAEVLAQVRALRVQMVIRKYREDIKLIDCGEDGGLSTSSQRVHISSRCLCCQSSWSADRAEELHTADCLWALAHAETQED